MFQNLGIALGSGVDEWHRQQDESRKQTAESRADTQFKQQQAQYERQMKQQSMQDALMEEARQHNGYMQQLNSLPDDQLGTFAQSMIEKYNKHPAYANGMFANMTTVDGKPMIVHGNMAKLGGVQMIPVTRQDLAGALGQMGSDLRQRLAMTSPEGYTQYFDKEREFGLKGREVGAKERANEISDAHFQRSDATNEAYRQNQAQLFPEQAALYRAQAGYYNRMPRAGGGGSGGGMGLTDEQASLLNQAMQYEEYAKQLSKSNPAAAQQYRNASIRALDGLPAKVQLGFRGKFGNAPQDIDPWDMPVKMKKMDPKTGVEIESQVPMKVADPEGFAKYQRGLAYSNISLGGPSQQPAAVKETAPYVTRRGMNFVVVDPMTNRMEPTSDYERRTGNAWADLPVR